MTPEFARGTWYGSVDQGAGGAVQASCVIVVQIGADTGSAFGACTGNGAPPAKLDLQYDSGRLRVALHKPSGCIVTWDLGASSDTAGALDVMVGTADGCGWRASAATVTLDRWPAP